MPGIKPFIAGQTVVHMHVPKCAGTSLHHALMTALAPRRSHVGIGPMLFGPFQDFASVPSPTRSMLFLTKDVMRVDADYVGGHIDFSILQACYPHAAFLTVLREPIVRIMSNWLFWRSWPWSSEDFWGNWGDAVRHSRWPLREFINDKTNATNTDNTIVRMLLGVTELTPSADFIDEKNDELIITAVKSALEHFSFVDIAENSRLFSNLSEWLLLDIKPVRENQLARIPDEFCGELADELDDLTMADLFHRSRLDIQVWCHVASLAGFDPTTLRVATMAKNVARFAKLFSGR